MWENILGFSMRFSLEYIYIYPNDLTQMVVPNGVWLVRTYYHSKSHSLAVKGTSLVT